MSLAAETYEVVLEPGTRNVALRWLRNLIAVPLAVVDIELWPRTAVRVKHRITGDVLVEHIATTPLNVQAELEAFTAHLEAMTVDEFRAAYDLPS